MLLLAGLVALAASGLAPAPARAHGDAVLELGSSSVAAGARLAIAGSSFDTGSAYRLRLVGALDQHDVAEVRPDSAGEFTREISLPADVRGGRYELVAVAPDGDVVARARLTVRAGAAAGGDGGGASASGSGGSSGARHAEIELQRHRSGLEWGVIGLLVGGAGGLGAGLLRRRD